MIKKYDVFILVLTIILIIKGFDMLATIIGISYALTELLFKGIKLKDKTKE